MVRAELVDSGGRLVSPHDPSTNTTVSFAVISGAGRILGTISGSPWNLPLSDPAIDMTGAVFPAHYGMLRAFVKSTRVCTGTAAERELLAGVHADAGRHSTSQLDGANCSPSGADEIVVLASAKGLPNATIRIPVTADALQHPLVVAAQAMVQ